jgi:hypothetical protein
MQSLNFEKSSAFEKMQTVVEQIATSRNEPRPFKTELDETSMQLVSPERIDELSDLAAENIVEGMIAQDREDFETACFHFSLALRPVFPEYDGERIFKAAEAYTNALFAQSKLKDDDKSLPKEETLHDDRWEPVRSDMIRMCDILDMPKSYGTETVEWFRYHAIRDDAYVKHLLETHRVYLKRVLGNDRYYRELAGLYIAAVALHDKHERQAVSLGKDLMRTYFGIIFREKYGFPSKITVAQISSASS